MATQRSGIHHGHHWKLASPYTCRPTKRYGKIGPLIVAPLSSSELLQIGHTAREAAPAKGDHPCEFTYDSAVISASPGILGAATPPICATAAFWAPVRPRPLPAN